jgi:sigma-B regulation protein RsbU (phosphoserine phosphatase)
MGHFNWLREDFSDLGLKTEGAIPADVFLRFFDLSLDLLCIADLSGRFLRINPNFSKVLGYSDEELLARPFLDFVHPDDHQATLTEMQRLREGRDVVRFRNRYVGMDGHCHGFEWTAKVEEGIIYGAARNLSQQLRLEEEISSSRNRERAILDHTPALISVKGIDQRYQFINRHFAEVFHVDQEDVIGKDVYDILPREFAEQVRKTDELVVQTGDAVTVEAQVPHDDGVHSYISVKFPILDSRGEVKAVASVKTDISDRLRAMAAEQELALAQVFQRTLYPDHAPEIEGLEIAGASFPVSHVCGDYYDFLLLGSQGIVVSLGDVAGHGYKPALQMVELRSSLRVLLQMACSPQVAVEKLNDILCADFVAVPSFVSFFLASIDVAARSLRYIGAGHDAFVFKADGQVVSLDSTGMVLGVLPGEGFPEAGPFAWECGDVFVVFTDGFNEAMNQSGKQFGKLRVLESLIQKRNESARAMIDNLFSCVNAYVGDVVLQDDMTVVVVKAVA